jgi:hypothetical protein
MHRTPAFAAFTSVIRPSMKRAPGSCDPGQGGADDKWAPAPRLAEPMRGARSLGFTWPRMALWWSLSLVASAIASTHGGAQPRDPGTVVRELRAFFAPLLGDVTVEVVDRDSAGREEYRAIQAREFSHTVGGRYIREVLIVSRDPRHEGGVILHGAAGDTIRTFNFWGAAADGLFVTWRFDGPRRLVGSGTELVGGVAMPMRAELAWENDALVWRTWVRPVGRPEYLDHTLTYTRAPGHG